MQIERLENREVFAGLPYGAMWLDTAEFMLGTVAVTPVFLESNGQVDASTENWTSATINAALDNVRVGTDWWEQVLAKENSVHTLDFVIDTEFAQSPLPTKYEPITHPSDDYTLWVSEFLQNVGYYKTGNLQVDMLAYNNAQRLKFGTDWAYTIFILNSTNDADGMFALGGSFLRAFAFPGGLYINTPSSRPASTIAHESGHMFWTFDEYAGGDLYTARRGYYLTQNTNAAGNRTPGFVQEPSIMASGDLMQQSWDQKILPASTKALIGWKDSDGDGIFDVLDVPLELDGTGAYETATGNYRFRGSARPGTLPNKNNEGMGNDISLNKISRIEARFDGESWFTVASPDSYTPDLDLNIPLTSGALEIEIRAVSLPTGVTSNVFKGRIARADAVTAPGINGFVWLDNNKNGLQDVGEYGEAGWKIEVLSSTGQTLNLHRVVEPDTFADGPLASTAVPGISIRSVGTDADGRVGVFGDSIASTGTKTFRGYSRQASSWMSTWSDSARRMQVDFGTPTSIVEIDVLGVGADAYGKMEAFDSDGNLIDRTITSVIPNNGMTTMKVVSPTAKIAYVQIGSQGYGNVRLDKLRYGPETTTLTEAYGKYTVPYLPSGNYIVRATSPNSGAIPLTSGADSRTATVTLGQVTNDVDFAFKAAVSDWQNPRNRFDVSNDGFVTPMDALILINELNQRGPHSLLPSDVPPPYFDVSGDGYISPLDALLVINYLNNSVGGSGEGESPQPDANTQAAQPDILVHSVTTTPVVNAAAPLDSAPLACDPWSAGSLHSNSEGEESVAATDAVFADDWLLTWLGPSPIKSRRSRS